MIKRNAILLRKLKRNRLYGKSYSNFAHLKIVHITLIRVIIKEGTMASAETALVCGLKVRVVCQRRLCVNSDANETLA